MDCEQHSYKSLSLAEFIDQYEAILPQQRFYELTLPWLTSTESFMLPDNSKVIVHCLFQQDQSALEKQLIMAWPLVHKNEQVKPVITSLSSFYSSIAEPIFLSNPTKNIVNKIIYYIKTENPWQTMQLGPLEEEVITQSIIDSFPYQKLFADSCNVYQENIADFNNYYRERPSQLRNTIKRREKKLENNHVYRTEIITTLDDFPSAFEEYKNIYQQSWKGDEHSFDFIEQVCVAAIAENKLRFGLLYVDERPVAAQLWFIQLYSQESVLNGVPNNLETNTELTQGTASIFKLAYVPEYQKYSVGSILSMAISEYVIEQDKVTTIEFGMGNEPYKKDWLSNDRLRHTYQVFNPSGFYGKLTIIRRFLLPQLFRFIKGKAKK